MLVRRVTTVRRSLRGPRSHHNEALPASPSRLRRTSRWVLSQSGRAARGGWALLVHPRTGRLTRLVILMALMAANAAATWTVNHQTWAAGVLAVTNGANTLLLIIGILDWRQEKK